MPSNGITADCHSVTAIYTIFARVLVWKTFMFIVSSSLAFSGLPIPSECAQIPKCWNHIKYGGTKQKYKMR